jgi:hypothetical protein
MLQILPHHVPTARRAHRLLGQFQNPTMLKLKPKQRDVLIDKLPDVGNLAAGALVFGQMLSDRPFSLPVELLGLGLWLSLMAYSLFLGKQH